ncbi:hypothetical protein ABO01nite_28010 [Asaia bogorensis NBRC 16594]|uniref:Uncharacterized protein n=1 Tax=Asaia bogorensis NBRC 16594 TaxID=1231624 RepID=A0AAN4U3K5_9PROT|nr:hypothetical protein ABO01nite_28010 [Asaia bogorensis NBRC 16594]
MHGLSFLAVYTAASYSLDEAALQMSERGKLISVGRGLVDIMPRLIRDRMVCESLSLGHVSPEGSMRQGQPSRAKGG